MSFTTKTTAQYKKKGKSVSSRKKSAADKAGCSKDIDLLELSSEDSCDESECTPLNSALKRLAIIDTLNVIHQCAKYSMFTQMHNEKCDAIGLLWLVRELLRANFDVKMYIPDSYMKGVNQGKVVNFEILTELQSMGYLSSIRDHSHDDLILLELAKSTGGFIISNDQYRDHAAVFQSRDAANLKVIRERVVPFSFNQVPVESKWPGPGGKEGLAKPKANGYLGVECILKPTKIKSMYSLSPEEDETHWMVFDRRVQRSQRQTEIKLERLDLMSEYYRLIICDISGVRPDPMEWWNPEVDTINRFSDFNGFKRSYKIRQKKIEEEKEQKRSASNSIWNAGDHNNYINMNMNNWGAETTSTSTKNNRPKQTVGKISTNAASSSKSTNDRAARNTDNLPKTAEAVGTKNIDNFQKAEDDWARTYNNNLVLRTMNLPTQSWTDSEEDEDDIWAEPVIR